MANDTRIKTVIGVVMVGLGALFLMGRLFDVSLIGLLWPFFVIVPGLLFFVGMVVGGKPAGPLAIPGSIVTTVGLLLFYQNAFNHWASWAYAWTLIFPTAIGLGLMINGAWSDVPKLVKQGVRLAGAGIAAFLAFGFFFEVILNISGSNFASLVWPLLLIAAGVYLLTRGSSSGSGPSQEPGAGSINEFAGQQQPSRPVETPIEETKVEPTFEPLDMTRTKRGE